MLSSGHSVHSHVLMASVAQSYKQVVTDTWRGAQSRAGSAPGAARPQLYEYGMSSDGHPGQTGVF